MVGEDKVHLFDMTGALPDKAWAPNPLRTRAVLNYKKIPYTESFTSPPDIEPLLKSLNVPANPKPAPIAYTVPVIAHKASLHSHNPTSAALGGSWEIAVHLDNTFQGPGHPSIFPSVASKGLAIGVSRILGEATAKAMGIVGQKVMAYLDDRGKEHMNRTRKEMWGKTPAEFAVEGEELEEAWKGFEEGLSVLAEMLAESEGEGPFFEGSAVGYADLLMLGWLRWISITDKGDFERVLGVKGGEFRRLWEAGKQWAYGRGEGVEYAI